MIGFIVGIGSLVGLAALRKRGCGYGGSHAGPWRHQGRHARPLWRLFAHLDATPGQERLIRERVEELWDRVHELQSAGRRAGDDLGTAMRAESLDAAGADEILARHDGALVELRKQLAASIAEIHEVLDPRQRERLARFISARGLGRGRFRGGPYRSWS